MLTDTHCHLTAPELRQKHAEIIKKAQQSHVSGMIVPATRPEDWSIITQWRHDPMIRTIALGIHPWFCDTFSENAMRDLDTQLRQNPDFWVGEIGLDTLRAKQQPLNMQTIVFEQQLSLAQQYGRRIVLHNVKATQAIIASFARTRFTQGGIAHGFSGSLEEAHLFLRRGFKIGLGALLLNERAKKVHILAKNLPENSILLETDSPYMMAQNRNTPDRVYEIAQKVAQLRDIHWVELAQICEKNLQELYG